MDVSDLKSLGQKNFSDETNKKIHWVTKMYRDWRNCQSHLERIPCELDDISSVNEESIMFAMIHFLTEVKELHGTNFPPRSLYDIVICVQLHLKSLGFS